MKHILASCIALAACGNHHSTPSEPSGSAAAPTAFADLDGLWALAPDGVDVAVVISPQGMLKLEHAVTLLDQQFAPTKDFGDLVTMLHQELKISAAVELADFGLSHDKGAAIFHQTDGSFLVIVPLGNRERFVQAMHGSAEASDDHFDDLTCKVVRGYYACASQVALFDRIGKLGANKSEWVGELSKLGVGRGDVDLVVSRGMPFIGTAELSRGTVVVRGVLKNAPAVLARLQAREHVMDTSGLAGFGMLDFPWTEIGTEPLLPGITTADVTSQITGPVTMTAANGADGFLMHIPLKETRVAGELVKRCAEIGPLAALGATSTDGVCSMPLPGLARTVSLWVAGNELLIGEKGAPLRGQPVALDATAAELAQGSWLFSIYARGTVVGTRILPTIEIDQWERPFTTRAASFLDAVGFGMRREGRDFRILGVVRTLFANPDPVISRVLAIKGRDLANGTGAEAAAAIAKEFPDSPFARDLAAGYGALGPWGTATELMAQAGMNGYIEYMHRTRMPESMVNLNRIAKNAKTYFAAHGKYPPGRSKVLPAKLCCPNKCEVTREWQTDPVWSALDFRIDEPNLWQYSYESKSDTEAVVRVVGDMDCDGFAVQYRMDLSVKDGQPSAFITEPAPNTD